MSLPGDEVGAAHFIFARHALLRRPQEAVEKPRCARVAEPRFLHHFDHLCNLQSTGDSPGPEIDVIAHRFGKLHAHDDVGELQPPAGLYDPIELGEERFLVRDEVDDAV